jgi:site-specific recombinase XerD
MAVDKHSDTIGYQDSSSLLDAFCQWLQRHRVAKETTRAYSADVRRFVRYMETSIERFSLSALSDVSGSQVEAYRQCLIGDGLKDATIKRDLMAVRKFFDFLVVTGLAHSNPAAGVKNTPKHPDILKPSQVTALFEYLSRKSRGTDASDSTRSVRDKLILLLMLFHGVRQMQIPELRLSALRQDGASLQLEISPKRSIRLDGPIISLLHNYLAQRSSAIDRLLIEEDGPMPLSSIRAILSELSVVLGIRCNPISFNHTYLYLASHPDEQKTLLERCLNGSPSSRSRCIAEEGAGGGALNTKPTHHSVTPPPAKEGVGGRCDQ